MKAAMQATDMLRRTGGAQGCEGRAGRGGGGFETRVGAGARYASTGTAVRLL